VIETTVPPAVLPPVGLIDVTVGTDGAVYVKWSEDPVDEVPLGVVTVTSTVPAVPAGEYAVMDVLLLTAKPVAAVEPKLTWLAPVKPLPVMTTTAPPAVPRPWRR
jgi:hypothetical protein